MEVCQESETPVHVPSLFSIFAAVFLPDLDVGLHLITSSVTVKLIDKVVKEVTNLLFVCVRGVMSVFLLPFQSEEIF